MARGERHKPGLLIDLSNYILNPNPPKLPRLNQPNLNAALSQGHPWIDVRRIVVEVDEHTVSFAKVQPAGDETQPERCRPHKRDFLDLRAEQGRSKLPGFANLQFRQNI